MISYVHPFTDGNGRTARAMHAFLENRTEGSIRSGCNRYDVSPHVLSVENMISDIQKVLQPVVDAMRA